MMRPVLLVLAGVALSLPAWSAEPVALHVRSAGDLAELCGANPRAPEADAKINYCHGFAQAAVDLELAHAGDRKPFCFPSPPPSRTATLNEFASWVRANPERRTLPPFEGLFRFLGERFPCR
nr:Rap1a/Tai family immunity protein [uncultured Rhodopila sp.]